MSTHLKAVQRPRLGSRHCRMLRAAGKLPASVHGQGKAHAEIALDMDQFLAARRHHENLFDLDVEGGAAETVMVREIQYDAFGDRMVHVEFRRVVRGVAIEADVELVFVGQARGGVLTPLHRTIKVSAIPSKIPDVIEVDASAFTQGQSIAAKDIKLPDGVKLADKPDMAMAVVAGASAMEVTVKPEDAAGAAPAGATPTA